MNHIVIKTLLFVVVASLSMACNSPEKKQDDTGPRRIEMLFLGHESEHHNSGAYMPILAAALSQDGINITYTTDVNDLNPQSLALYDGLIIYANHEEITPSQEE